MANENQPETNSNSDAAEPITIDVGGIATLLKNISEQPGLSHQHRSEARLYGLGLESTGIERLEVESAMNADDSTKPITPKKATEGNTRAGQRCNAAVGYIEKELTAPGNKWTYNELAAINSRLIRISRIAAGIKLKPSK